MSPWSPVYFGFASIKVIDDKINGFLVESIDLDQNEARTKSSLTFTPLHSLDCVYYTFSVSLCLRLTTRLSSEAQSTKKYFFPIPQRLHFSRDPCILFFPI